MADDPPASSTGEAVRWLTYEEAGRALGIDAESVSRRARRLRWRRQPGNDGRTRVALPLDALPDSPPVSPGDKADKDPGDIPPDAIRLTAILEAEVAGLRDLLGREQARADRAEVEVASARQATAMAREAAARAEGAAQAHQVVAEQERQARLAAETRAAETVQAAEEARRRAAQAEEALATFKALPWWRRALARR